MKHQPLTTVILMLLSLGLLMLTACISPITVEVEQDIDDVPVEIQDPMATDNQRIIDEAHRDGRLYQ